MMTKRSLDEFDLSESALAGDPDYTIWCESRDVDWKREMDSWAADYDPNRTARSFADDLGTIMGLGPRK